MEWLKMIGLCLLAAVMVMVLRPLQPEMAGLLAAAFGGLLLGYALEQAHEEIGKIGAFLHSLGLDASYYRVLLKSMGIVLVTQITVQICGDMDAPSVARRAEMCGRLALLGVAAPVFMELTQMAVNMLQ